MHSDTDTLLVIKSKGAANGSVSANRIVGAGATIAVGSSAHVTFEVLDGPVYYEITAHGVTGGGGGSAVEMSVAPSWSKVFEKKWHAAPDSLITSGWLDPGYYSFDAGSNVWVGAGMNNPDGDRSASGSISYEVVFRILDREPKKEPEN